MNLSASYPLLEIHTIPLVGPGTPISTSCGEVQLAEISNPPKQLYIGISGRIFI